MASATPGQRQPTPKRAAIEAAVLAATEQLLAEGASYADLNIERIATRAGISRTAFYFYFRDKRDLLMRLTEQVGDLLYAGADRWFSGDGDPVVEIREALVQIAALYAEHGVLLRAIVEVSAYDEETALFWRGLVARFADGTRARIEREQQAGRTPAMSARATAFAATWMIERTFYQLIVQGEPIPPDEIIDALAGLLARGLYARMP